MSALGGFLIGMGIGAGIVALIRHLEAERAARYTVMTRLGLSTYTKGGRSC